MHPRRVLANDRKKALTAFRIFFSATFESLNESHDRCKRRAYFGRNVGEKFLPHEFEPFRAGDVEEHAERTFGAMTVDVADRHDAQIEDLSFRTVNLDFNVAAFVT